MMYSSESVYLVLLVAAVAGGLAMAGLSLRAYAHTRQVSMILVASGFVLLVVSDALVALDITRSGALGAELIGLVGAVATTLGYLSLLYSLYLHKPLPE